MMRLHLIQKNWHVVEFASTVMEFSNLRGTSEARAVNTLHIQIWHNSGSSKCQLVSSSYLACQDRPNRPSEQWHRPQLLRHLIQIW